MRILLKSFVAIFALLPLCTFSQEYTLESGSVLDSTFYKPNKLTINLYAPGTPAGNSLKKAKPV